MEFVRLVSISDEDNYYWNGQKYLAAGLYVRKNCRENGKDVISIILSSSNKFTLRYEHEVRYSLETELDHIKSYIFDRIPEDVTMDWLLEHSFFVG